MRLASLALATALVLGALAALQASPAFATPNCGPPSLSTDSPQLQQAVTATRGNCAALPLPAMSVTLEWFRCTDDAGTACTSIPGVGDSNSYTPTCDDVGTWLKVTQTASDGVPPSGDDDVDSDITANPVAGDPTADFTFTTPVFPNQAATFTEQSDDPTCHTALTNTWDFDNDGKFDATGDTVQFTFTSPGDHTVRVRATDPGGGTADKSKVVTVEGPPVADFTISPQTALTGQAVQLTSTSSDPDHDPLSYAWDLDGDGDFSDGASGATATVSFAAPGSHVVALRVTADAETSTKFASIVVKKPPATTPASVSPRLLSPFPVVIISGRLTRGGARLSQLTIRAPKGSTVRVICHGRRCPYRRASHVSRTGKVRFRGLQKRLPAGTVIEVFVTKPGTIGKYTRFRIRAGKPPRRLDRCLLPSSSKPSRCPSQ
jgi:PKD domain-containing protein